MAIRDLLSAWSIDDGAAVQELTLGNNNRTYAVTTPTRRYILRIYQRSAALAWVRYEHTLCWPFTPSGVTSWYSVDRTGRKSGRME